MSKRAKAFYLNGESLIIDFGTYALLMYYAKQVNQDKAKKLFETTISESNYRVLHDLPDGGLDPFDDAEAHWVPAEVADAIAFIDDELIPALNLETQDLFEKYGSKDNFVELFYDDSGFLEAIDLEDDEFYYDDIMAMISYSSRIRDFIQLSLTLSQPYKAYVR